MYKKTTFHVNELILTPLNPFDIKCKRFKRQKQWGRRGDGRAHAPQKPFKIFADHATICNIHYAIFKPNPMQHLRWSSLWQKLGNGWKLLLTVVT